MIRTNTALQSEVVELKLHIWDQSPQIMDSPEFFFFNVALNCNSAVCFVPTAAPSRTNTDICSVNGHLEEEEEEEEE